MMHINLAPSRTAELKKRRAKAKRRRSNGRSILKLFGEWRISYAGWVVPAVWGIACGIVFRGYFDNYPQAIFYSLVFFIGLYLTMLQAVTVGLWNFRQRLGQRPW